MVRVSLDRVKALSIAKAIAEIGGNPNMLSLNCVQPDSFELRIKPVVLSFEELESIAENNGCNCRKEKDFVIIS
jgi:hypothetical protein